jgi:hypothetical protein
VENETGHNVYIELYPVSMVFNAANKYTLISPNPDWDDPNNKHYYINGSVGYESTNYRFVWECGNHGNIGFKGDYWGGASTSAGRYGFGVYKLDILSDYPSGYVQRTDSCLIEYDFYAIDSPPGDLKIRIEYIDNHYVMKYRFCGNDPWITMNYSSPVYYTIKAWQRYGPVIGDTRPKNFGPGGNNNFFVYKDETSYYYNYNDIPLDPRRDCDKILPYPFPFNSVYQYQNHKYPWYYNWKCRWIR